MNSCSASCIAISVALPYLEPSQIDLTTTPYVLAIPSDCCLLSRQNLEHLTNQPAPGLSLASFASIPQPYSLPCALERDSLHYATTKMQFSGVVASFGYSASLELKFIRQSWSAC